MSDTSPPPEPTTGAAPTRKFALAALVVIFLVGAGLALFASGSPDGLERVATDTGFADTAGEHAAAGSPLADYQVSFLDGALGSSLAGVAGILLTLGLFYGLTRVVRRNPSGQ